MNTYYYPKKNYIVAGKFNGCNQTIQLSKEKLLRGEIFYREDGGVTVFCVVDKRIPRGHFDLLIPSEVCEPPPLELLAIAAGEE